MGERSLCKQRVGGSNPSASTNARGWLHETLMEAVRAVEKWSPGMRKEGMKGISSAEEHLSYKQTVAGSTPASPTNVTA